ncbi:helix-turn-helix transcriptional regulator [Flagellimonas meishanensis]|uniref:helix-turn-helix transcriptional regulator n=1 Tax=Flagellimonas meishanensis TaxID=2873264 RepID=UPI001CA7AF47|nr:helix-turn-helix domain-containing protein [[Muricauda] meishanensis]
MFRKFNPEINKVHFITKHTLFHIISGRGSIQVDFKNYTDWMDKIIFLEKGQYIKFLSNDFEVGTLEFPNSEVFEDKDVRVLFKHLISLGHIDFRACSDCQKFLAKTIFEENSKAIINASLKQWFSLNPFNSSRDEYEAIFDIKEIIDREYPNHLTNQDFTILFHETGNRAQSLFKNKVGVTVKAMLGEKRLVESKKEVVFTHKSIQEVSHEMGFKDPAYFNRVFKNSTGYSPTQFRENFDFERKDTFVEDIVNLVQKYHQQERSLAFYADKMHLSVKALAKKTKERMNESLGRLIRNEVLKTSKQLLEKDIPIKDVAIHLGFEEPNHFSTFFKHQTGVNPTEFKMEKVQENALFL